jgi:hypothetical protein
MRYFCNRCLQEPAAATRELLQVVRSSRAASDDRIALAK